MIKRNSFKKIIQTLIVIAAFVVTGLAVVHDHRDLDSIPLSQSAYGAASQVLSFAENASRQPAVDPGLCLICALIPQTKHDSILSVYVTHLNNRAPPIAAICS